MVLNGRAAVCKRADLRVAYSRANDVYEELKRKSRPSAHDEMCIDLASMVIEAIACFNHNERINSTNFMRIMPQKKYGGQAHLIKLGYSLSVLLNALLVERFTESKSLAQPLSQESTSHAPIGLSEPSQSVQTQPVYVQEYQDASTSHEIKEEPGEDHFETAESAHEVKTEPVEEPVEVKEEPIDDDYEVKQEDEEPVADVFCPATGDSRPLEPDNPANDEDLQEEVGTPWTGALNVPRRSVVVRRPNHTRVDPRTGQRPGSSNFVGKGRACFLCAAITDKFEQTPPLSDKEARDDFFSRIITNSQIAKERLDIMRYKRGTAFFCASHLKPSLKKAVSKPVSKKSPCIMCSDPQPPLCSAPANPFTRRRFLSSLISLDPAKKMRIAELLDKGGNPNFCSRHFRSADKLKIDDLDKKGERFASTINARRSSILRREMPPRSPPPPIQTAFPRVSPVRVDVGYPSEDLFDEELKEELKEEPLE